MSSSTFIGLVNNSALLATLVLIYDVIVMRRPGEKADITQIPLGMLIGIIGVFIMMTPWEFRPGIIIDTRSVLLCISGLFFGTLPTLTAALILAGYRIFLGGTGVFVGLATILTAGSIGIAWRHLQKKPLQDIKGLELYTLGFITHAVMLACMFMLPWPVPLDVLEKIGLPVMLILPLGTLLIGKLMANRIKRIRAAETLEESENKYSTIFNDHSAVKLIIDPHTGNVVDANKAAEEFYGWSKKQLCRMTIQGINILSPEQIQEEMKSAETQERNHFEFQHRMADGSIRDVEVYSSVVEINKRPYLHSIIHDITIRKSAELQLRETQAILQAAMDNSQAGIAIANAPDGSLRYVNNAGLLIHGGDRDEMVKGVDVNTYVSSWHLLELDGTPLQAEEVPLARAVRYGESCTREFIIRRRQNDDHIVLANAAPITDAVGKITAGIVVFLDITERKKLELELVRQKKLFETMFNSIPDGVVITDTERRIILANRGMEITFGYSPDRLIGQKTKLFYADDKRFHDSGKEVFNEDAPQSTDLYTTMYRKSNGEEFPGETFGAKLYDDKGTWLGNLGIMRDVSSRLQQERERVQLQKQLLQAQKMEAIGTLAGGIAHDFNNILGAILGYAEMAYEDCPQNSIMAKDIKQILVAGNRARDLVSQILAFSRQTETELILLNPVIIVKEILKLLRSTLPSTIEITQDVDAKVGCIIADPTQIHQILMNICTNAFHAMEETGGALRVSVKKAHLSHQDIVNVQNVVPGVYVQFSVDDTGMGISPAIRDKIFDPYFTTKKVGRGTGMGLSIAQGIVMNYGGFITCDSKEGEGTIFKVFIPISDENEHIDVVGESAEIIPVSSRDERILVVDDEKPLAEMIQSMLERLGYQVTIRTDSLEALATFRNDPDLYDLVITDQTMPGMTGFDLAGRMLQTRPQLPIILCTGFSNLISEEKVKSAGIKEFVHKPIVKKELLNLINNLLSDYSSSDTPNEG